MPIKNQSHWQSPLKTKAPGFQFCMKLQDKIIREGEGEYNRLA